MRISLACLVALCALPAGVMAQDASVHDKPAVRGSIIANLLQDSARENVPGAAPVQPAPWL
ncbi:hypothetical protein ACLBQX_32195, partial [Klebsiella pneumoniae]